jgi:hypothetical protein
MATPVTDHLSGAGRVAIRGSSYLRTGILEPYAEKNRRVQVVVMAESVSSRDLRAMMDLIRDGYADEPAEGLPAAVGAGLSRLVRCDSICLFELARDIGIAPATAVYMTPACRRSSGRTTGAARPAATPSAAATSGP